MIVLLVKWLHIFITLLSVGVCVHLIYEKFSVNNVVKKLIPVDYYILAGMITVTTFLGYISIIHRIGIFVYIILTVLSFLFIIVNIPLFKIIFKRNVSIFTSTGSYTLIFTLALIFFVLLIHGTSSTDIYDVGLYHAQAIQWINKFHVIPGLGNLHGRLAFNSHFLLISALYDTSYIGYLANKNITIYALNSFFLLVLFIRLICEIFKSLKLNSIFGIVINLSILISSLWLFRKYISSPSPDIIVAILCIYIFLIYVKSSRKENSIRLLLIGLILLIPTFKLSASLVILLIPLLFGRLYFNKILSFICFGAIIFIPFLVRNFYLSGYLLYPFPALDLFIVDWKIPIDYVLRESYSIKNWAKTVGNPPANPFEYIPIKSWFIPWVYSLRLDALILFIFNIIAPIMFFSFRKIRKIASIEYLYVLTVSLLNFYFCMLNAPTLRFAFGFLIFNMSFIVAVFLSSFVNINLKKRIYSILIVTAISGTLIAMIIDTKLSVSKILTSNFITSEEMQTTKVYSIGSFDSVNIVKPVDGDQCFNTLIPCTPYFNEDLKLRGDSINQGFIVIDRED